jgi:tetraacyldisaccharide 4'-kinase
VAALLEQTGLRWERRSSLTDGAGPTTPILLLDTMGEVASLLPQAACAVIGGTWDASLGGHSPAEAAAAGLPVVAGPARSSNPAAWTTTRTFDVADDATPAAFARALRAAIDAGRAPPPPSEAPARALALLPAPVAIREQPARPWLAPLVPLVRAVGAARRGWRGRVEHAPVPVVSVGGLAAGGVGKTPVVAWLAAQVPGAWVVARGYRRGPGPAVRIGRPDRPPTHDLGDELEMLRRRGIPVVSAPDRVAGARAAAAAGARIVLLDDGFQHRRLHRDLDVVCLDARWPGGEGAIPVGTRREPWSALHRADFLWSHHAPSLHPQPDPARGAPAPPLKPTVRSRAVAHLDRHPTGPTPVALGLARPEGPLCALLRMGVMPDPVMLVGDHRPLPPLPPGCIVTEKDAARLPPGADARVLRMTLEVAGAQPLLDRIATLVGP